MDRHPANKDNNRITLKAEKCIVLFYILLYIGVTTIYAV